MNLERKPAFAEATAGEEGKVELRSLLFFCGLARNRRRAQEAKLQSQRIILAPEVRAVGEVRALGENGVRAI